MNEVRKSFQKAFELKDNLVKNLDMFSSIEMNEKGVDKDSQIMLALDNALTNAKENRAKEGFENEIKIDWSKTNKFRLSDWIINKVENRWY